MRERQPGNRFAGAGVPVGSVAEIAFLAVQIGMDPGTVNAFIGLRELMGGMPVALAILSEGGKRESEAGGRRRLGEAGLKFG
ncbi:MAG: hypothetical protein U1F68_17120 [Gammaproteobacteria bacterium]